MSLIAKLGLTTALVGFVGVGAIAGTTVLHRDSYSPYPNALMAPLAPLAPLAGLVNLAAAGTTSVAPSGPMDQAFTAKRVHLDKVVAQLELIVTPPSAVPTALRVQAWGKPDTMKQLQVRVVGDKLYVRLDKHEQEAWFPWNVFNMWSAERLPTDLKLRITAPSGTPYQIEDMSGSIEAGDLDAPLSLQAHAVSARFGRVQSANISVAGSGKVLLGPVREQIDVDIAGTGHVETPSANAAHIEIAGGGEAVFGALTQGLDVEIAGSGDVRAASINGPFSAEIAGSGDVVVDGGTATSFNAEIAGSGDIMFRGHAVNPRVEIMGSGSVTVGSYAGNVSKDIAGSGDFKVLGLQAPAQPAPVAPPAH